MVALARPMQGHGAKQQEFHHLPRQQEAAPHNYQDSLETTDIWVSWMQTIISPRQESTKVRTEFWHVLEFIRPCTFQEIILENFI